jgi:hypothetical protein
MQVTSDSLIRAVRSTTNAIFSCFAMALFALVTQGHAQSSAGASAVSVQLLYSPETATLVRGVATRFNALHQTLPDGTVVQLSPISFDDLSASARILKGEISANLWLAPSSAWVSYAQTQSPLATTPLSECASLFTSKLGIVYRFADSFAVERVDGSTLVSQLVDIKPEQEERAASLLLGSPLHTASGMAHMLAIASSASSGKLATLRPADIEQSLDKLSKTQDSVRNYFLSDYSTIDWLSQRNGGQPLAVLTLESAYKLYKSQHRRAPLEWSTLAQPSYDLDFPLCTVERRNGNNLEQQAIRLVRGYLTSNNIQDLITASGFTPPKDPAAEYFSDTNGATRMLINAWPKIRHPSSTIFLVDTSIKTNKETLEAIKREISQFISNRLDERNLVSLVASSTSPDVLAVATTQQDALRHALERMTTAGGTATRDGLMMAFDLFADARSQSYRRAIVAIVSSKDTSSRTALSQFLNRGNQLIGRRNVDLYVLALGGSKQSFGDLSTLVNAVGGTFINVEPTDLQPALSPIFKQLQ